jgi:hypothetical protein
MSRVPIQGGKRRSCPYPADRLTFGLSWMEAIARRLRSAVMVLLLACCACGGVARGEIPVLGRLFHGKKRDKHAEILVETQQSLLRFANEYSMRMVGGVDGLRRGGKPLPRAEELNLKIGIGTETWNIAAGPNAVANLLDMTIFVTVTRMALEKHWQPHVFGKSALPMLAYCRTAEATIWKLTRTMLKPEQEAELREGIAAWHRTNPLRESLVAARALGFASRMAEAHHGGEIAPGSVFNLLMLDPFAGMEPAVREVAETRLFAERALFITQKMPMSLQWQTELLALNAVSLPEVQRLLTNSTNIAASMEQFAGAAERFARVAEQLPGHLSSEREQILTALESQEKQLAPLVSQVHQTIAEGTKMSTSLNTTFTTFDALMKRFGVGEPKKPEPPPDAKKAEPFRILDYAQTAAQLEVTAGRLTELIVSLDRTLDSPNLRELPDRLRPVVQQAQTGSREIVDYAFWKGILLVGSVFAAALLYRILASRVPLPGKARVDSDKPK